jgi:hypothetical protein
MSPCAGYTYMSPARYHQPGPAAHRAFAIFLRLLDETTYGNAAAEDPEPQWPSIRLTESVRNACVFVFMHMGPSMMRLKRPWSEPSTTSGSLGRS